VKCVWDDAVCKLIPSQWFKSFTQDLEASFLKGKSEIGGERGEGDCDLNSLKFRVANHIFYECVI
jgi:hypothetical protein